MVAFYENNKFLLKEILNQPILPSQTKLNFSSSNPNNFCILTFIIITDKCTLVRDFRVNFFNSVSSSPPGFLSLVGRGDGVFAEGDGGLIPQSTLCFMFTYTFLTFLSCFSLTKMCFYFFHFIFVMKYQIFTTEY